MWCHPFKACKANPYQSRYISLPHFKCQLHCSHVCKSLVNAHGSKLIFSIRLLRATSNHNSDDHQCVTDNAPLRLFIVFMFHFSQPEIAFSFLPFCLVRSCRGTLARAVNMLASSRGPLKRAINNIFHARIKKKKYGDLWHRNTQLAIELPQHSTTIGNLL